MSRRAQQANGDGLKCDGPVEAFVAFAKNLTAASATKRVQRLAEGPNAERFAQRLVQEAFGGSPHAATCMSLIGRFGNKPDWAARFRAIDVTGEPPAADRLQAKDLATVGAGLCVISREKALPWLARGYLRVKTTSASRTAVQNLLVDAASTTHALAAALANALDVLEAGGMRLTKGIAKQCTDTLEQHAHRLANTGSEIVHNPLARLATVANRADAVRLLSALLVTPESDVDDAATKDAIDPSAERRADKETGRSSHGMEHVKATPTAISQAAWSEADEALGRALQDMGLLDRSLEKLEAAAQGELADRVLRAKDASDLVLQWVRQAARYRSVAALNKVGDRVPFDPAKHELDGDAQVGELVRVVRPTVVRGSEPQQIVLLRGEAEVE